MWGQGLVEALDYVLCEGKEGSSSGVIGSEAMLGGGNREGKFR